MGRKRQYNASCKPEALAAAAGIRQPAAGCCGWWGGDIDLCGVLVGGDSRPTCWDRIRV